MTDQPTREEAAAAADRVERRYGRDHLSEEFRTLVDYPRLALPAGPGCSCGTGVGPGCRLHDGDRITAALHDRARALIEWVSSVDHSRAIELDALLYDFESRGQAPVTPKPPGSMYW